MFALMPVYIGLLLDRINEFNGIMVHVHVSP